MFRFAAVALPFLLVACVESIHARRLAYCEAFNQVYVFEAKPLFDRMTPQQEELARVLDAETTRLCNPVETPTTVTNTRIVSNTARLVQLVRSITVEG